MEIFALAAVATLITAGIGGLFIGKALGRTPLSSASPNKTMEGLIGGMVVVLIAAIVRDGRAQIARGRTELRKGDHVIVMAEPESVDTVAKTLD